VSGWIIPGYRFSLFMLTSWHTAVLAQTGAVM